MNSITPARQIRVRLPVVAAAGVAAVVAQGYRAGHRSLPHFGDSDVSGSLGSADGHRLRVVALGDSTLTGPGLDDPDHLWLRQVLVELPDVRCSLEVRARGGAKTRDVVGEQLGPALATHPDLVVISVGSNDAIRGVPQRVMEGHLRSILGAFDGRSVVVLMGIGDMATIPRLPQPLASFARLRAIQTDRMQARVAAEFASVMKVPMYELAGPAFRTFPDLFLPDLFHPNERGHAVWAAAARPTIIRAVHHVLRAKEPA